MNKNEIVATTAAIATGFVIGRCIRNRRHNRIVTAEINAEKQLQIQAIQTAGRLVSERIDDGKYHGLSDLMDDFNFELIAARFND